MSVLKYDHERRPNFQLEHSDFRAHYEGVALRALWSIRRHWKLIASIAAVTVALACAVIPLLPRQYSASALVYPNLFSDQGKVVPLAAVDAASIVTSEARLIVSDAILQAVVERLELASAAEVSGPELWRTSLDWIRVMFFPETRSNSVFDRQVSMLRNKVDVMKDTRSYLISITFTARSADEATRVVNAIAIEYLRDKTIQRRRDAVAAAEGGLARQLAIYGERHPKVLQSADALAEAQAALKVAMSAEGGQGALAAGESVKLAIPNRTPTSPKGFVILSFSILFGVLAGIGLAIWRDRRDLEPGQSPVGLWPPGIRPGRLDDPPDPAGGHSSEAGRSPGRGSLYSKNKSALGQHLPPPER